MKKHWVGAGCMLALLSVAAVVRADEEHGHEARIEASAAEKAGIVVSEAKLRAMSDHVTLSGRIGQNRNTTYSVPARFPSVVREVYVTWGEKVVKGQKLALLENRSTPMNYEVTAPAAGSILKRNVNIGDLAQNEPLFVIANLSNVWAEFHVFPRDLGRVMEGQSVHVKALEVAREATAAVAIILPMADAFSQTVMAVVELPNPQGLWRPGMAVEGDVHLSKEESQALAVEEKAVQRMEDGFVVFVQEGESFHARDVKLGKTDGGYVEIIEGLKAGERYVSEGSFLIKAEIGKGSADHEH